MNSAVSAMVSFSDISRRTVLERAKRFTIAVPLFGVLGCDVSSDNGAWLTFSGATMGTRYRVKVAGDGRPLERYAVERGIERILETVNDQMSTHRTTSELSRFNSNPSTSWVSISPDTSRVVGEALRISQQSAGAFDVTIGPLVDLWGFGPGTPNPLPPSVERIQAQFGKIGHTMLDTRLVPAGMRKARPGLHVDLCGIAKGFAVDRIAEYLEQNGARHYLVEIGGEMRVRGSGPYASGWRIGIEKPVPGRRAIQRVVRLRNAAIATSGDYRNFFESGGTRYAHIVDPRTGMPVTHSLASVTVIAPTTILADAWSTALMVLGPDHGLRLADHFRLAALFIVKRDGAFRESYTAPFAQVLAS
jgi:thiamine biosynthesis lipoprotein